METILERGIKKEEIECLIILEEKIKGLAKVISITGIVLSILMGIAAMFASFIMGLIYMVIGSLASWVGGFYI